MQQSARHVTRHARVLVFILVIYYQYEAEESKRQRLFTPVINKNFQIPSHWKAASMKSVNKGKNMTPPDNSKRSSSNPLPASPSVSSRRRSSAPQCRIPCPPGVARKPSPPRPDWQRPPGKACNSPSHIPIPVNPASARKVTLPLLPDGKIVKVPNVELTPPTPSTRSGRAFTTPKTPSPLLHQVKPLDHGESSPTPSDLRRRHSSKSTASSTVTSTTLIPPLRSLNLSSLRQTRPPTPTPASSSPRTPTHVTCPEPSCPKKHDSFSPLFNNHIFAQPPTTTTTPFAHARHLSPTRPLPPSPSTLHPYISKTHIMPSCTSGTLTHRLLCNHLIITTSPETCKQNCKLEVVGYAVARLKAQGFMRNIRDLDLLFICPICVQGILFGNGTEEDRLDIFEKMLRIGYTDNEIWIAKRKELVLLLGEGDDEVVREFVMSLGRDCRPVLDAGLLAQSCNHDGRKALPTPMSAPIARKKSIYKRLTETGQGLGIRI